MKPQLHSDIDIDTVAKGTDGSLTSTALKPSLTHAFWGYLFYTLHTPTAELAPYRRKRSPATRDPESHMSQSGEPCGGIHGYVRLEENCRPLAVLRVESVSGSCDRCMALGATVRFTEAQSSAIPDSITTFFQPRDLSLRARKVTSAD